MGAQTAYRPFGGGKGFIWVCWVFRDTQMVVFLVIGWDSPSPLRLDYFYKLSPRIDGGSSLVSDIPP